LESPEITIPVGTPVARMSFDHFVATESGFDGGNVKISVNGGAWQLVQAAHFVFYGYNATLATIGNGNTNPLAGQPAFTGTDGGSVTGSWGRSIVNLAPYAGAGDKIKLRFEAGKDGCGGITGWYMDDLSVYSCPTPCACIEPGQPRVGQRRPLGAFFLVLRNGGTRVTGTPMLAARSKAQAAVDVADEGRRDLHARDQTFEFTRQLARQLKGLQQLRGVHAAVGAQQGKGRDLGGVKSEVEAV
ncbi:MAG: hypothetical protein CFE32_16150, partial [Alphaproteobacteria bacterium PA3]